MKALSNKMAGIFFLFIILMPSHIRANDLLFAISAGDLNKVKDLISRGAEVNTRDFTGRTPLMWASLQGRKEIVDFLLSRGADVNIRDTLIPVPGGEDGGKTPLMYASWAGQREIVDLLLSKGADINAKSTNWGETSLFIALREGNKGVAELLISKGADINATSNNRYTPLMIALDRNQTEIAKLLIFEGADINMESDYGDTPLILASIGGQRELVGILISKGAVVNHKNRGGVSALLAALSNGHVTTAEHLLFQGADSSDLNAKAFGGQTPLMSAAQLGRREVVEFLIQNGANINARDYDGRTALMFAALFGANDYAVDAEGNIPSHYSTDIERRKQVAELLILKGADVNARDYDGKTPLMYAAMNDLREMAALFLSKGAVVNATDSSGKAPLDYALQKNNEEMADLIGSEPENERTAKEKVETQEPFDSANNEFQEVKDALVNFFNYLHDGQYDKAVLLFEPWKEGTGMHESSWEGISSSLLPEDRNEKGKALGLGIQYRSIGVRVRARVLDVRKADTDLYRLRIQFVQEDGSIYAYGPCCGESEETTPPLKEFIYFVERIDGVYKVRTPPLFRP
ncbi:MAG: ankyrin repeat domain-containing protein [bacterium]